MGIEAPTIYVLLALAGGFMLGLTTGGLKTSTVLVVTVAAVILGITMPLGHPLIWGFLLGALFFFGGAGALGAWAGVELRGWIDPPPAGQKKVYREAIRCPHCGANSIDWWDKLMSGLCGRHCLCDNCGHASREERRKERLITSVVFLATLYLIGSIAHAVYAVAAMCAWIVLLIAVEWYYVYAVPLAPVVDSPGWKRIKDVFAWGFVALIVVAFVSSAIFNSS